MRTGISVAFLDERSGPYGDLQDRVWWQLASSPEWQEWLGAHHDMDECFSRVSYEDREQRRIGLRAGNLTCREPVHALLSAIEADRGEEYFAELFRAVYVTWAQRLGLPVPPLVPLG